MHDSSYAYFAGACIFLLFGHAVRAIRSRMLFPPGRIRRSFNLLMGLALGYLVNALVPFRLGELVRVSFVAVREDISFSYSAATVVCERTADLVVVGLIFMAFAFLAPDASLIAMTATALALALLVIATAFAIKQTARARKLIWMLSSVFNDRVRFSIADFAWSTAEIVTGGVLLRRRFVGFTIVMWALYGASYLLFGRAVRQPLIEVLQSLLGTPLQSMAERIGDGGSLVDGVPLLLFSALPVLAVIAYGFTVQWSALIRMLTASRWYGRTIPSSRDRFKAEDEYGLFLAALFSDDDHVVSGFGLRAIDDGVVQKFFNGGSDAITALVEANGELVIRKFAVGVAAAKLKVQADWLSLYTASNLSVVDVIDIHEGAQFFRYDMKLIVPATDFHDVIHTSASVFNETLLQDILTEIDRFHDRTRIGASSETEIAAYLDAKVLANAGVILAFARDIVPTPQYRINAVDYDFDEWQCFFDVAWLKDQIRHRTTAVIHGDLTIENVIISPGYGPGWYLIDPNPDNAFNSPLIDWAKLMQSLHLGYESLNRGTRCTLSGSDITLSVTRSQAYSHLHALLESQIRQRFGDDALREIYFHELIHYLRLTPYKIRQDIDKGLTFFACTTILLRRYNERWGGWTMAAPV